MKFVYYLKKYDIWILFRNGKHYPFPAREIAWAAYHYSDQKFEDLDFSDTDPESLGI